MEKTSPVMAGDGDNNGENFPLSWQEMGVTMEKTFPVMAGDGGNNGQNVSHHGRIWE